MSILVTRNIILLFHIFFVAPLLLYIGIQGSRDPTKISAQFWFFLILLGASVAIYHSYLLFRGIYM